MLGACHSSNGSKRGRRSPPDEATSECDPVVAVIGDQHWGVRPITRAEHTWGHEHVVACPSERLASKVAFAPIRLRQTPERRLRVAVLVVEADGPLRRQGDPGTPPQMISESPVKTMSNQEGHAGGSGPVDPGRWIRAGGSGRILKAPIVGSRASPLADSDDSPSEGRREVLGLGDTFQTRRNLFQTAPARFDAKRSESEDRNQHRHGAEHRCT